MERKKCVLKRSAAWFAAALLMLFGAIVTTSPAQADAVPRGVSYMNFDNWGGTWWDAEKSPTNPADDQLCWAATAANVLAYTGWGYVDGMSTSDDMFAYFVSHWTNLGSLMDFAWEWWFDGTNDSQGWSGWSQVSTPGGGFYPYADFWSYYHEEWTTSHSMAAVDQFLHLGYGIGLAMYTDTGGAHAITCWGYNYDPETPSKYLGIWVTDSDDDKYYTTPPDRLRYYDVACNDTNGRWYLQDFYGSTNWYIGGVEALQSMALIPEPATMLTLVVGLAGLALRRRYHKNR